MQQQQQPLEIDMDLYNKLLKCGIFRAGPNIKAYHDRKKVLLDQDTTLLWENGVAFGKYLDVLKNLLKKNNQDLNVDSSQLQLLKVQYTPQARLFNWNLICQELDKVGIQIDSDSRSLMVAGDHSSVMTIFNRIERFVSKVCGASLDFDSIAQQLGPSGQVQISDTISEKSGGNARKGKAGQKKRVAKDGVDILTMNAERNPNDTESTLELLLNTLCRAFQMKPKQAAALLTNNNQFLIHSIVKGVKGKYEPLLAWYYDLHACSKHFTSLMELEVEQFPGSNNFPKVLIGYDFGQNQVVFDKAMLWFLDKEGGLELHLHAFKKHQELAYDFVTFVSQFSQVNAQLEQVYKIELKKQFSSPLEYVNAINDLMPFLIAVSSQELRKSGILDYWLESCIKQADNDGKHSFDERISALTLAAEIWLKFTDYIDLKEELPNQLLLVLKRGCRDKYKPIRIVSSCMLFKLLDKFSDDKNASAPAIYKALIFSLVENPGDSMVRDLYFSNFITLLEANPSIPIGLIVEPLIKQIQVQEGVNYFYKISDFDFFVFIAKHPKLTIQLAIPLVDLLAKIYLNDVSYSSAASIPFMLICTRFIQEESLQEFLIKFETICFSMLLGLEKNAEELQRKHQEYLLQREIALANKQKTNKLLALPPPPNQQRSNTKPKAVGKMTKEEKLKQTRQQEEDINRRLKKTHIVEISIKIQKLRSEEINDQLRDMLLSTNKRFSELYGYFNKGIMALLKWWGEPEQVMGAYIRAIEEREAREREEIERIQREEEERVRREQEEKERIEREERERRQAEAEAKLKLMLSNAEKEKKMGGYGSDEGEHMVDSQGNTVRGPLAIMPYKPKPNQILNMKAMQQIEKIKRSKQDKEEQKRLEEERKQLQVERNKKKLKDQILKRNVELGAGLKQNEDSKPLIFNEEPADSKKIDYNILLPQIKLLDLDQEEDRDKETVNEYMKKYAKLWKNLFHKYANSCFSSKQINNFDQLNDKLNTINVAEMTKLLKEHGTLPQLINKQDLQSLFRLINNKYTNSSDLQALDYNNYVQLMLQLAYFCFSRPPRDLSYLPPVETIRAFISNFEAATRARGHSVILYEDPDATSANDRELIMALNEKLHIDPSYPVPEGYYKQVERIPHYDYRVPESAAEVIGEAQTIAVELLDDLLNNIYGVHFLEPLVTIEERLKVKQQVKNLYKPQAEALNYMKKVEKRIKPLEQQLNDKAYMSVQEKRKENLEVRPKLNLTLKLEVAQFPLKERANALEVAEVLEEMLNAVSKGQEKLGPRLNRAPGQIQNEVKKKKHEDEQKYEEVREVKEDKRQKRDVVVKSEIQKLKEQKEKEMEERQVRTQSLEANKKKIEVGVRKKTESKKARMDEIRQKNLEEIQRKREEEDEKNKTIAEQKKKERIEFMKQQKQKLAQEFDQIYKERDDLAKYEEEVEKLRIENEKKLRSQMEDFIKEHQQDRHKEEEERKQINSFLHQHDVESTVGLYDKSLHHLYMFYASQDNKTVDFNLEANMSLMNLREFIRFGYQQNIVPALLQPEDMVQIYRQLIRERIEEISLQQKEGGSGVGYLSDNKFSQVLNYEYFKKGLVRIAVMAQDLLGGQKEDLLIEKLAEETKNKEEEERRKQRQRERDQMSKEQEIELKNTLRKQFEHEQNEILRKTSKSPTKGGADQEDGEDEEADAQGADTATKTKKGGTIKKKVKTTLEINATKKANEDAFFDKWIKQREAQGVSLKKRIIGREKESTTGKKIIKKKRVTLQEQTGEESSTNLTGGVSGVSPVKRLQDLKANAKSSLVTKSLENPFGKVRSALGGGSTREANEDGDEDTKLGLRSYVSPQMRKNQTLKQIKMLEEKEQAIQSIGGFKIEDRRIKKDINVGVVSAKTIEAMLIFLGIEPDDSRYQLDNKLNKARIEIQGQKPNKIKKQLVPNKLETIKENHVRTDKQNGSPGADRYDELNETTETGKLHEQAEENN